MNIITSCQYREAAFIHLVTNYDQFLFITDCPTGWIAKENSCYLPMSNLYDYPSAESACRNLGSHLLWIEGYDEWWSIINIMEPVSLKFFLLFVLGANDLNESLA